MAKYDMQLGNKGIIDDVNSSGDSTYSSEKIESLITESGGFIPDNYYTKTQVDSAIQTAIENITEAEGQEV